MFSCNSVIHPQNCTWLRSFRHTSEFHTSVLRLLRCYVMLCYVNVRFLCCVVLSALHFPPILPFILLCVCSLCSTHSHAQVQFTQQQHIKAQTGSTVIALIFNLGARGGWVVNATPRLLYPRETYPLPVVREAV